MHVDVTSPINKVRHQHGFTLIELTLVILIIGLLGGLIATRTNTFSYWKEEGYVRKLAETVTFLHHQAVVDQAFYRLELDLENNSYKIGVMRAEGEESEFLKSQSSQIGNVSLELAAFLNPGVGETATFIPPPSFPSLAEPNFPPEGLAIEDVQTMRGKEYEGKPFIMFSPRGFSEFAVIHLRLSTDEPVTILVNPFMGNTKILREYKDFVWTYGRDKKE